METLRGKKIVLGITGSIAAYKACYLIRGLIKRGAEVQVVITPAGKEFITPVTLSALTSKPVVSEFFSGRDGSWHLRLFQDNCHQSGHHNRNGKRDRKVPMRIALSRLLGDAGHTGCCGCVPCVSLPFVRPWIRRRIACFPIRMKPSVCIIYRMP